MIENASRLFDGLTWRRFWTTAADETREYTARNSGRVYTDDIISITSVKMDQDGDGTYEVTLAATDYFAMPSNYSERGEPITWLEVSPLGNYSFTTNRRGIQIAGKFGFCAASTVAEARTFTAPLTTVAYVDNLSSITTLTTDNDNNGTYETTWTVTTDYLATAVTGTITTLLSVSGAKTFPVTANGVRIAGVWNLPGVPADVKMAIEEIVINVYEKRFGTNTTGAATITGAGVVITPKDIPDTAWRTIEKYKRGGN